MGSFRQRGYAQYDASNNELGFLLTALVRMNPTSPAGLY